MDEKKLNTQRNHGSHYRQVKKGSKRLSEIEIVAKAGSKPVVEVRATKYCLHCFEKEYTIHYKNMCQGEHT